MESPIQISHDRLVRIKLITASQQQPLNDHQESYFIYEIDDNHWQNVNPNGESEYDLEEIKQEKTLLPIGIIKINKDDNDFSFEGDLTVNKEDQSIIFNYLKEVK